MYFQPEDNRATWEAESGEKVFKNYRFKHEWNITFLFNFLRWTEEVETIGKNGGESSHTWKLQEKVREKPIRFWRIILLTHYAHVYTLQSTSDVLKQSSLSSFLSIWLIFSDRNYMLCLIDYNFNWYWHHALHLKKKTFPIFENLLKTWDTATKVLSRLKIPQTRRRVDRLASCENIVPRFQTSSGLLSPWRNSTKVYAEEFYYSFY